MCVPRPVLILQHAASQSPGLLDLVLSGLPVDRRSVVDDPEPGLPQLGDLAGLVALGAPLHRGATQELGFGELDLTPAARTDPVLGPLAAVGTALHWHTDAVDHPQMRAALGPDEAVSIDGDGAVHLPLLRRAAVSGLTTLARAMAERG